MTFTLIIVMIYSVRHRPSGCHCNVSFHLVITNSNIPHAYPASISVAYPRIT